MRPVTACAAPAGERRPAAPPRPAPAPPRERGSPADVHTVAAVRDGVEIVVPCEQPGSVGVIGRGRVVPPPIDGEPATYNRWTDDLGERIRRALGDAVGGIGWGLGCTRGDVGPRVYVVHHASIDEVVVRLADFMRREDLGVRALVLIQPDIVPL